MDFLDIPTHFNNVITSAVGNRDMVLGSSPIEYRIRYTNNIKSTITVVTRSGLRFTLPSQFSMTCNKLIIRVDIFIHNTAQMDVRKVLSKVSENSSNEMRIMRDIFTNQIRENKHGGAVISLDYSFTKEDLIRVGGSVYSNELDYVISLDSLENAPPHPHSYVGDRKQIFNSTNKGDSRLNSFKYSILLVDNDRQYGPRYISIGSNVFKINPIIDNDRKDGVYVINSSENMGIEDDVIYFSMEDAKEKIGLFRTREEAKNNDEVNLSRKMKIAELEHESTTLKVEVQKLKHVQDMDAIKRKSELEQIEMERSRNAAELERTRSDYEHKLKMERERQKDYYESRSYERKDQHEILKYIPAVITTIGAIVMAIKAKK